MKRILALSFAALLSFPLIWSCSSKEEEAPVIEVRSISIEQSDMTLTEGESVSLSAKVLPEDATDKTVSWSSSEESAVMISSGGKALAVSTGKAVITAKSGNKSDFITITVVPKAIPVTGVSLDKTQITIKVGESETLTATITPEDATNKKVSWASSNNDVATVEEGKVVGVQPGSVTITVTTEDGAKTAECPITVKSNLAPSVTVGADHISAVSAVLMGKANLESTASADLTLGIQYSKSAGILPSNSTTVEVSEADSEYNYSTGITGLDPDTKYYFRSFVRQNGQDTYGETMEFTTKEISSMIATKESLGVTAVSARLVAKADMTDVLCENKSFGFYYGTSNTNLESEVAATEGDGNASADISVLKSSTQYFYQAFVKVDGREFKEKILSFTTKDIESVLETKDATSIEATSAMLNAKLDLTDVQYKTISFGFLWGSSESAIDTDVKCAEMKDNAFEASLTDLSHKTQYWYKAYVRLDNQTFYGEVKTFTTDIVPVESVSLDKTKYTFNTIGNTLTLKATVLPVEATDNSVTWTSSNESVATVSKTGFVKACGNGEAIITVTTNDRNKKATCTITVKQLVTGVVINPTTLTLNEGQKGTLTTTVTPYLACDKTLSWTSSSPEVATVDASGVVTAVSKGTASITARANDGSGKYATCAVYVKRQVSSITLDKTSFTMYRRDVNVSELITHTVVPSDASNTGVSWTSSDNSVASVSAGQVTGLAPGKATIQVWANDGSNVHSSCEVEVVQYVTGIDLVSLSIVEGQEHTMSPSISPTNANNKSLAWTSSDESVATIDDNGRIQAISKGTVTITSTAKDGSGTTASCIVTVKRMVTGITLDKTSIKMERRDSDVKETITATVTPSDASNTSILWSSSNQSVATVSNEGVVTGLARGNAVITARTDDGSEIKASCAVEVFQYVTGITLSKSTLTLTEGQNQTVTATVAPATANDKTITWSSSNPSVATVDNNGKIVAVSKGYATIRATARDGSGVFSSCHVTVIRPVVSIGLDKTSITMSRGKNNVTETLTAIVTPSDASNTTVLWSSSNMSVVTVSSTGVVTGLSRGNAVITARTDDGSGLEASCAVEVKQNVTGITLDKTSLVLNEGQTQYLTVKSVSPANANDKSYTWMSLNPSIATVDEDGRITAVSKGETAIKVISNDGGGEYAICSVTVKRLVSSIDLDRISIVVYNGKTELLNASVFPSDASNTAVTWTSSDMSVATVSGSGVITGVSSGNAIITATAVDGSNVKASCYVEVRQYVTGITIDKTSIKLNVGKEQTLAVTGISPDSAYDKTVSWTSSNQSVATVDENGKVVAISEGNAIIKAVANDGSEVSASCNVRVLPKEAVDLGLSVYWSSCNLGGSGLVEAPEEYGSYFAWGETSSNRNTWSSYKLCNGSAMSLTKYNNNSSNGVVDARRTLELSDDAAHVKLGSKWRMPTKEEWQELLNNCNWGWTSQNGVNGLLLTSRKNGASIFLPAFGLRDNTTQKGLDTNGYYWSSSLNTSNSQTAWNLSFSSGVASISNNLRCFGLSIRPVYE